MTHDIDRTRLAEKAQHVIAAIKDLEALAIAGATQHERQLDMLREELAKAPPAPTDSMAVGLDDIRTILEEETHPVVQHLLVIEDDKVQVIDSLHQLLGHIVAVDTKWPASEMQSLRLQLQFTQDELRKANTAALANAEAEADYDAALAQDLQAAIDEMVAAITPINRPNAKLARLSNPIGAMRIITEVIEDVAKQILDGAAGEGPKALAVALADADRIEDQIHAIEAVCEAGGMPPTIEREDIPAWLAEHLTTRIERKEKVKKAKKVKAPAVEADDDQGQLSILDEVSDA